MKTLRLILTLTLLLTPQLFAQTETVIYNFVLPARGYPSGSVVFDSSGNLWGAGAGQPDLLGENGAIFEIQPGTPWTLKNSYAFNGADGFGPSGGLVLDASGNVYGIAGGGPHNNTCPDGCGLAYELSPKPGGGWHETVLHDFNASGTSKDGYFPNRGLVRDGNGNLYGTAQNGGTHTGGIAFELSPKASGGWQETPIFNFGKPPQSALGSSPGAPMIFDSAGNLYGTTESGGAFRKGTVFELSPKVGGGWSETVLYSFQGGFVDGQTPYAAVAFDAQGNLYGTTYSGGAVGYGIAFELSPPVGGGGTWTETILHSFSYAEDASNGLSPLVIDATGNVYGTTYSGGSGNGGNGYGSVFELSPGLGGWTFTVLHIFNDSPDGAGPSGLIFDAEGNLYGTTQGGGLYGYGTVFEITP